MQKESARRVGSFNFQYKNVQKGMRSSKQYHLKKFYNLDMLEIA